MCRLFVEKVQKEQQELAFAATQTEPDKQKEGFVLNIERGIWVREVPPAKEEEPKTSAPALVEENSQRANFHCQGWLFAIYSRLLTLEV